MADPVAEAARELSRARWRDTRVRSLVAELLDRIDEVDAEQAELLRAGLAAADREAGR